MSVAASYLYRDGRRVEAVPFEAASIPATDNEFIWIGLHKPSRDELLLLQSRFGLHELSIADALSSLQMPKLSVYDNQLFVIAKTAQLEGDHITYGETAIFVGKRYIITVRNGSERGHGELVRTIEDSVFDMERKMLDACLDRSQIARIFKLRREVILFQRVLDAMLDLCGKLYHLDLPSLDREAKPYFRDALQHMHRVETMVASLRDVITSVFEASNLLEQQRQGTITRQLAAWAAILAVPTAIAGIYGMNFDNMPELKTSYGYFIVLAFIAVMCIALFIRFKRARWI
jgi:magnesium transporter